MSDARNKKILNKKIGKVVGAGGTSECSVRCYEDSMQSMQGTDGIPR